MKKLLFVACLLVPGALWLYGKAPTWYAEYKAASTVGSVIREIPLSKAGQVTDAFKQFPNVIPQGPVLTPPHVVKAQPVKPEHHWHLPFTHHEAAPVTPAKPKVHYPVIVGPAKPVKPTDIRPHPKPLPPPQEEPETFEEKQPIEFCAFGGHCGYLQ